MMDADISATVRSVDGVDVKALVRGSSTGPSHIKSLSGSGPNGRYHVNRDRVVFVIANGDAVGDDNRWPVEIGGREAGTIDLDELGYHKLRIPNTVETGQQTVTVDGVDIGTIRVYNPDYPLPDTEPAETTPDPPDPTGGSSGSSGIDDPEPSPTPDPSGSTDSGSSIDSRTRAAVIAVMGVVAALIATR